MNEYYVFNNFDRKINEVKEDILLQIYEMDKKYFIKGTETTEEKKERKQLERDVISLNNKLYLYKNSEYVSISEEYEIIREPKIEPIIVKSEEKIPLIINEDIINEIMKDYKVTKEGSITMIEISEQYGITYYLSNKLYKSMIEQNKQSKEIILDQYWFYHLPTNKQKEIIKKLS
jgi:hypothetical protein